MARRIGWTEIALADLEATAEFIARDSAHYAKAVARETFEAAQTLRTLAERGHVVPEFLDPSIRELFVHSYRLIYQVTTDKVVGPMGHPTLNNVGPAESPSRDVRPTIRAARARTAGQGPAGIRR